MDVETYIENKLHKAKEKKFFIFTNSLPIPASGTWANSGVFVSGSGCNFNLIVATPPSPNYYQSLFNPVVGSDNNSRTNDVCYLESIEVSGNITIAATSNLASPPNAVKVRISCSEYFQTNGSFLDSIIVMTNSSSTGYVDTHLNYNRLGTEVNVLWQDEFIFSKIKFQPANGGLYSTPGLVQRIHFKKTFDKPIKVCFYSGANTGQIGDILGRSYWIHMNCTDVTLAPQLTLKAFCVFTD